MVSSRLRRLCGAAAVAVLLGTFAVAGPAQATSSNNSVKKLTKSVTLAGVLRHLVAFQAIASLNGGNRASGGHAGPAIGRRRPPSDGASIRCVLSEDRGCGEDPAQRQSGREDEGMCTHGSITYSNSSARAGLSKRPENAAARM